MVIEFPAAFRGEQSAAIYPTFSSEPSTSSSQKVNIIRIRDPNSLGCHWLQFAKSWSTFLGVISTPQKMFLSRMLHVATSMQMERKNMPSIYPKHAVA